MHSLYDNTNAPESSTITGLESLLALIMHSL